MIRASVIAAIFLIPFAAAAAVEVTCPALPTVSVGTYSPATCDDEASSVHQICALICPSGYHISYQPTSISTDTRICLVNGTWEYREISPTCKDWEAPVLTCPGPEFTVNNDKGKNVATVNWDFSFTDNSLRESEPGITINSFSVLLKINGKNVDTSLPKLMGIGKNSVTYDVLDAVGNSATCGFTVDVKDSEPPVFTFCPGDILIDNATAVQMRIYWQQAYASDNSGVPPAIYSSRQAGEPFSVPGSYEIVIKAVDGSGNEATCSFRITLQRKSCTLYPAPQNGALACLKVGSDLVCAVMCKSGSDFVFDPPMLYFCSGGEWLYHSFVYFAPTLPWPDCSAQAKSSSIKMLDLPYYFFSGDVNDPNVIDAVKDNFISLLKHVLPGFCLSDPQCNKDNVEVKF